MRSKLSFGLFVVFILLFTELGYPQQKEHEIYPSRPVQLIVPYPPGGTTDLSCRLMAKEAEKYLRQPIVVLNKPGAAVGLAAISVAKPDGYTIGLSGQHALTLSLMEKVPFHPVKDFKHIIQFGAYNLGIFVKADSPFKSFGDLIAYARKNPKKVTWGSPPGAMSYFITEQIAKKENVQFTLIPYRSAPEYQPALLGGHIHFAAGDFNYSLLEAGEIRLLLLLREERSPEYPQTPVLRDLGYSDIPAPAMIFIAAPKGVPEDIRKILEEAFTKGMKEPGFISGMKELHMSVIYRDGKTLDDYVARNYEFLAKYISGQTK